MRKTGLAMNGLRMITFGAELNLFWFVLFNRRYRFAARDIPRFTEH